MKKIYFLLSALILVLSINACDDNPVQNEAKIMTIEELVKTPGFSWYYEEKQKYQPEDEVIEKIKQNYDDENHDFYLFVKASCTCPGNHNYFPKFMKTLETAGIDQSDYTVYAMSNEENEHPFVDQITIKDLPAFFVVKQGIPVYSVLDSFLLDQIYDMEKPIEEYVLNGVKK